MIHAVSSSFAFMRAASIGAAFIVALVTTAQTPLPVTASKDPIEVSADQSLEYHQDARMYLARGAAKAARGDMTISAEELAAYERSGANGKSEIFKLTAATNVVMTAKDQKIFGDQGYYDGDRRLAVLTGNALRFVGPQATVTARDSLEYWQDRNQAVARGAARAVKDDRQITADVMTANFRQSPTGTTELQQLTAEGNVTITTTTDVARGDRAVYDLARNVAVLTGHVRVTRGKSQLEGQVAEVDFKTGISRMTSGQAGGRVRALFAPDAARQIQPAAR